MTLEVTDTSANHVHIVGIGGKGMSAIAAALLDLGKTISGSDLEISPQAARLRRRGVRIDEGHNAANIEGADLVIHSSAVKPNNTELAAARALGTPIATRATTIAALFNDRLGIAIAGTHGKTTTAAMTATILYQAGLRPSFLIGADTPSLGNINGRIDAGAWMVLEADEFDDAFLAYRPNIAVVTHLESDHLDHFGSINQMINTFETFVTDLPANSTLIARCDAPLLQPVLAAYSNQFISFGTDGDWQIKHYKPGSPGPTLDIQSPEGTLVLHMPVPGHHNALNAVAALAAAVQAGIDPNEAAQSLQHFQRPERRLELRSTSPHIHVYEDYAHHPTAVRATLQAVRELSPQRVLAVYQPLLHTRTRDLFEDFLSAFDDADLVIFAEIHSPPGRETYTGTRSDELAAALKHPSAYAANDFEEIVDHILAIAKPGDLVVTMGPESITPLADRLATEIDRRPGK